MVKRLPEFEGFFYCILEKWKLYFPKLELEY